MREISGFGFGYEAACRSMMKAGGAWADQHPRIARAITTSWPAKSVRGGVHASMEKVMVDAAEPGGATAAMFGTVLSHIVWVMNHSWEEWVELMRADLREELRGETVRQRSI
jgi:hypothetical protein